MQFGLIASLALIANYHSLLLISNFPNLIIAIILAISGGLYGSGFPDIDSKKSIPAYEHPVMRKVFELFHINHRGPISHSFLTETIIWGIPIGITYFMSKININTLFSLTHEQLLIIFKLFLSFAAVNEIRSILLCIISFFKSDYKSFSGIKNTILFLMTDDYEFAKKSHFHRANREDKAKFKVIALGISLFIFFVLFNFSGNDLSQYINFFNIFLVGVLAGVYSHLVMDMSTLNGVYLDFSHQIQVARWMKKNPVLRIFVPNNDFKTGSSWETQVRIIVSSINILLFILLFYHLALVLIK